MFVGEAGFWLEGILYCSFSPLLNRVKATDHCSFVLPGLLSNVRLQLYHGCLGFKSKLCKLSQLGVSHLEGVSFVCAAQSPVQLHESWPTRLSGHPAQNEHRI